MSDDAGQPTTPVVVPSKYPGNVVTEAKVLEAIAAHEVIRQGVEAFMARSDSPAVFALGAVLQLLSQCVHPDLYFPANRELGAQLFMLNIGPSGFARKTTPVNYVRQVLREAGLGDRVVPEPGSDEALRDQVVEKPFHILTFLEFGAFLTQTKEGYRQPIKMLINQLADGDPISRQTVGKKAKNPNKRMSVEKTRVSIYGAVTPDYLEKWSDRSDYTSGMYGRCLFLWAVRERELELANLDEPRTKKLWTDFVARIRELAHNSFSPPAGDGKPGDAAVGAVGPMLDLTDGKSFGDAPQAVPKIGRCLGFDVTARATWSVWVEAIKHIQLADKDTATLYARLEEHTQGVALLVAWCRAPRDGTPWYVGYHDLLLARFFIEHCVVPSYRIVWETLAPSDYARLRRELLQNVGLKPGDNARLGDLMYAVKGRQRDVEECLDSLCTEGWLQRSGDRRDPIYTRTKAEVDSARRDRIKNVVPVAVRNTDGNMPPTLVIGSEDKRPFASAGVSESVAAQVEQVEAVDEAKRPPALAIVPPLDDGLQLLEIPDEPGEDL